MSMCGICNKKLRGVNSITCIGMCNKQYCATCANLTKNELQDIDKKKLGWTCKSCTSKNSRRSNVFISAVADNTDASSVNSTPKNKNYTINDVMDKLINMELLYKELLVKYEQQEEANAVLRDEVKYLKMNMVEDVIMEMNDRNSRKQNIIVFGVPEYEGSVEQKKISDLDNIIKICNALCVDKIISDNVKCIRIGRVISSKIRPIKVIFPNESMVHEIIKKCTDSKFKDAFKGITLSFDRTPKQIDYFHSLKNELKDRQDKGDQVAIKYKNGVPRIVASLN